MKDNIWAHLLGYYWDWKKRAVALLVLALLVGIGLIAGYFAGDALASNEAAAAKRAPRALPQGAGSTWRQLAGLPGLGSEQAAALLADDDTPGGETGVNCVLPAAAACTSAQQAGTSGT
jgi:hypothetical protein